VKVTISPAEAGRLLSLHPATIRRLLASRMLPGFRVGHSWRIPAAAVERLLAVDESVRDERDGRDERARATQELADLLDEEGSR
jgi:excisionase family DNA binding protein